MRPLATLLALALLTLTGVASAHANLVSADPPPLSRFSTTDPPEQVFFEFTEPLDASYSTAHLLSPDQEEVEPSPARIVGTHGMALPVPERLDDGVYVATWRALSTVDGHVTAGAFVYIVGNATAPTDFESLRPQTGLSQQRSSGGATETTARGVSLVGLFLVTGVAAFVVALAGPVGQAPESYRAAARRLALSGAAAAVVGALAAGVLYAQRVTDGGAWWHALTSTRVGLTWLARAALAAAGALALALFTRRQPALGWGIAAAAGALALVTQSFASHAGGAAYPLLGILVDAVHLIAGAVWLGGLPALALALVGSRVARRMALAAAYSAVATWSVALVVLSGTFLSFALLRAPHELWTTPWGRALVAKLALVAALLALGAYNKLVLVPRIERGDVNRLANLRRTAVTESVVGFAIIASVALLTAASPPATYAAGAAPASEGILTLQEEGRYGTNFTLRIGPAEPLTPGLHLYEVRAVDDGRNVTQGNVTLHFTFLEQDIGTSTLALNVTDDEAYRDLGGNLALPGYWRVDVVLSGRPDALDERVAFDVVVEDANAQS